MKFKQDVYRIAVLLLHLVVCAGVLQAAPRKMNYMGRDFWLGLQNNSLYRSTFYITGPDTANITFNFTALGTVRRFGMSGGSMLTVNLSSGEANAIAYNLVETVSDKSLHITSTAPITIQFLAYTSSSDAGTLLFPSDNEAFSNEYYLTGAVMANSSQVFGINCAYAIVARQNNTLLEITPSAATATHAAGVPFTVLLNKGSTYAMTGDPGTTRDLSGTKIVVKSSDGCNPINVFNSYGNNWVSWPLQYSGYCCGDIMMDQLLPTSAWGTAYPLVPFTNNLFNPVKLISASNNSRVYFDGVPVRTLNAGQPFDTVIRRPIVVTADSPLSVAQFMVSQEAAVSGSQIRPYPVNQQSDPSMLVNMSLRDGFNKATYRTASNIEASAPAQDVPEGYNFNAVTIITTAANAPSVQADNNNIANRFTAFPGNSQYVYATIYPDTAGLHQLSAQGSMIAYYYGANSIPGAAAYGIGGTLITPIDSTSICVNDSITLTAEDALSYNWSNGAASQSIIVKNPGLYTVNMHKNCGIETEQKFQVLLRNYEQRVVVDTLYKCMHEVVTLLANTQATKVEWSDGTTNDQLNAQEWYKPYLVKETFQEQCAVTSHHFVLLPVASGQQPIRLGSDTVICEGLPIVLNAPSAFTKWSDSSVGQQLVVQRPGVYWAYDLDTCLETLTSDTISIGDCMDLVCSLPFPTAFTPNADGKNDLFRPLHYGNFNDYTLTIFDRWGQKVYQSYKLGEGWDGRSKGKELDMGTYFYLCHYTCPARGKQKAKGTLTLIR